MIALDARDAVAYNIRGDAYNAKGDDDRAIANRKQVIALKFNTKRPQG